MPREAKIHFELSYHLKKCIESRPIHFDVVYTGVEHEYPIGRKRADIVVFANNKPFLVIEAKRDERSRRKKEFDPYSSKVIRQAFGYAGDIGAKYFATYNGRTMVLFRTFEEGRTLLERRTVAYQITNVAAFAPELLREIAGLDKGVEPWDPLFRAFIGRLISFHDILAQEYLRAFRTPTKKQRNTLKRWFKRQGWDFNDESTRERFCDQCAYMLMNKLVFFKTLSSYSTYDMPSLVSGKGNITIALKKLFESIVHDVDFEAIYERDAVFEALTLTDDASIEVRDFLDELEEYNLRQFGEDVIGELYQRIIPPDERHRLGQYYTPAPIVNLIVRLTVQSGADKVLDPACGSGGFLIAAYDHLRKLKGENAEHTEILDQIFGFDINRFPLHLSAINLTMRDLSTETTAVNLEVTDFFDVVHSPQRVKMYKKGGSKLRVRHLDLPPEVDVILANPPYIRQESIDKERCRKHLEKIGTKLSNRSDIYAYFFTHASEFLESTGRMGFITSSRWLSVGYGEDLQRFFLDNFKIVTIIEFHHQVFEIPLIGTCVTILERSESTEERDANAVRFIRIKQKMNIEDIIGLVRGPTSEGLVENKYHKLVTVLQSELHAVKKWARFFYAPRVYYDIIAAGKMTVLDDIAEVKSGLKTGANDFFYFREKAEAKDAGIPPDLLSPLLKHVAEVDTISLTAKDISWQVLDVHKVVSRVVENLSPVSTEAVKRGLQDIGYGGFAEYITAGEERGIHSVRSVKSRRLWFDLGNLDRAPILFPEVYWRTAPCLANLARVVPDKRLYSISPRVGIDKWVLLGILNSSLTLLMREMTGRTEQGEGMNRNSVMIYEAKMLPVPDPRNMTNVQKTAIIKAIRRIIDTERNASRSQLDKLKYALDVAVLGPLGLKNRVDEVRDAVAELLASREKGAGSKGMVPVEVSTKEVVQSKLKGAKRISQRRYRPSKDLGQTTLEDFF